MNKQEIITAYAKKQSKQYQRKLQPFHHFLLSDFFDFLETVEYELPDEKIARAIERDSRPRKSVTHTYNHDNRLSIALITEDVGHMTGGRYYTWFIAMALTELGHKVTVYTNQEPVFQEAFRNYKQPEVKVIAEKSHDLRAIDVEADIYIGSPTHGNIAAMRLGEKYSKPSFALVFDPFPMMEQFIGRRNYTGWEEFLRDIDKSNTKIISLCQSTSDYIYPWLNKRPEQVVEIYPCINSREKAKVNEVVERGDYVLFISRLVKHKRFEDVLQAAKDSGVKLKVISSIDGMAARRLVHRMRMSDQVEFHFKITDQEKFRLIRGARAVINGAIFEGFGMWAIEALSCGIPLVCYDYPTFREIKHLSGADNFYFAEWGNAKDLSRKLALALKEEKFREDTKQFDFESMIDQVKGIFNFEPRIGVITIGLNEEQFIGASLRSTIRHKNITKVAVVEGAVNLFAHAATEDGLSIDKTAKEVHKAMALKDGHKIVYDRYGWAGDKSELRNRALALLGTDIDYVLVVDADEVWKQEDLDGLVATMKENPRAGVIKFPFHHFWKNKNQVTTGSQWDSMLFRCFKYEDKSLRWGRHELPVVNAKGQQIDKTAGVAINKDIRVYHYGYCKSDKNVQDKLKYYAMRDGKRLKVTDTFTQWKPGQPTQPTHGGGKVEKFTGTHPEEMKGLL